MIVMRRLALWMAATALLASCATDLPGEPPDLTRFEFPVGIALHPNGKYLYVVSTNFDFKYRPQDGGTLTVVDLESGEILVEKTMTLGSFGADIILNEDASRGFVAVRGDHSITWFSISDDGRSVACPLVVSADNRSLKRCTVRVASEPVGLAYTRSSRSEVEVDDEGNPILDSEGNVRTVARAFDMLAIAHLRGGNVTVMTMGEQPSPVSKPPISTAVAALVDGPSSVVLEEGTERFYVTGRVADNLVAFRPAIGPDLRVLAVFQDFILAVPTPFTSYEGRSLLFSRDGERLYLTNQVPDALHIFDMSQGDNERVNGLRNRLVAQIDLPEGPNEMAWVDEADGTPLLYITTFDENEITIVDPEIPAIVSRVDVGRGPYDIAVDAAGQRAYISNFREHSISVLDISAPLNPVEIGLIE